MELDCDRYRVNIPAIKLLSQNKTEEERIKMVSSLAVITGAPVIAVGCYIGELYGYTPKLKAYIHRLIKFYTIDQVLNVKPDENGCTLY